MNDACQIKVLNGVEVQENGIVRNSKGRIIARLVDSVEFDSEHLEQTKPLSDEEIEATWKKLWESGNIGHIAYNYAKAIEERHGIK